MLVSDLKFPVHDVIRYTLPIKAKPGQTDTVKEYIQHSMLRILGNGTPTQGIQHSIF